MRDIPILFSGPMVQAIIARRKTQTRRLAWGKPFSIVDDPDNEDDAAAALDAKGYKVSGRDDLHRRIVWPPSPWQKVKPGDRLYVRENFRVSAQHYDGLSPRDVAKDSRVHYEADGYIEHIGALRPGWCGKLRPGIHMPRWMSRITITVDRIKIERLQSISEEDADAEGVFTGKDGDLGPLDISARALFSDIWRRLHGKDSWDENPEVVAIIASAVELRNIDAAAVA